MARGVATDSPAQKRSNGTAQLKTKTSLNASLKTTETADVFTMGMQKSAQSSFETFVRFYKDSSGRITHFTVTDPRLKGHQFDRVSDVEKME